MDTKHRHLQSAGERFVIWIKAHPKQVYKYLMITLILSFAFSFIDYCCFTPKVTKGFSIPSLYSKSDEVKSDLDRNEKDIEKVIKELNDYKVKREQGPLSKKDSLRIEYLFNQYQNLKNGH